jgi:hypothetical protein
MRIGEKLPPYTLYSAKKRKYEKEGGQKSSFGVVDQ